MRTATTKAKYDNGLVVAYDVGGACRRATRRRVAANIAVMRTIVLLALVALPTIVASESFSGRVVGVSDGDTITILHVDGERKTPRKIRIMGIDAPESKQAYGNRAKQAMSDLVFGKDAHANCPTVDRYGRDVCKVIVNGVDVGLALIQQGLAWHFKKYQRSQPKADRAVYANAEDAAREKRVGLWCDPDPIPPWNWRKTSTAK